MSDKTIDFRKFETILTSELHGKLNSRFWKKRALRRSIKYTIKLLKDVIYQEISRNIIVQIPILDIPKEEFDKLQGDSVPKIIIKLNRELFLNGT